MPSGSQGNGGSFAGVEVADRELEVQLLGNLPGRPLRRAVVRDPLHRDQHGGAV
jgi:hypothetical protein